MKKQPKKSHSETDLVHTILEMLEKAFPQIFIWRQNTGVFHMNNRYIRAGYPGAADITGILPDGRRIEIEVKLDSKQSDIQHIFEQKIKNHNGVYILVKSVEEAYEKMKEVLYGKYENKLKRSGRTNKNII